MWVHLACFKKLCMFCFLLVQCTTLVFFHNLRSATQLLSVAAQSSSACPSTLAEGCLGAWNPPWSPLHSEGQMLALLLVISLLQGVGTAFCSEKVLEEGFLLPPLLQRQ